MKVFGLNNDDQMQQRKRRIEEKNTINEEWDVVCKAM
jgi:hypothetical protein